MNSDSSTIVVASAADARYALPLAVMLSSVGSHAPGSSIQAYVLDDGLSAEDRCKVAESLSGNVRLEWRQSVSALSGFPIWGRMSLTTYQKLTLEEWLPEEVDRVIWLDCDLLVLTDIGHLWRSASAGIVLAAQDQRVPAVSSPFGVAAWRELGLPAGSKYFNAGVLVIDLAWWRRYSVRRRSIDYLRTYADQVYFWDQEALNAVLAGKWGELDPRWNWHPALDHLPGCGHIRDPRADKWILHFSGNLKPWNSVGGGHWRTLYRSYLDRTAWAGGRPARGWEHNLLDWYETSHLRRLLYPVERLATVVQRNVTRRPAKIFPGRTKRA